MDMEVFDLKLGKDATVPFLNDDTKGVVAVKLLDAVQTIADVLTVNDGGKGWTVTFDPGINAYTDRTSGKRSIVVSGKPLFDAKPGSPLSDVARVMTGFVVHEVGHTDLDFFTAVKDRWPGKQLPLTLANIIEDVVLEAKATERYNGFADHGDGNIFRPTLEWVAKRTCPTTPLKWSGSTGHKVNVTGQIVRYRDFVTFSDDNVTKAAFDFVEQWAVGITTDLTPSGCVALIEAWLDYVQTTLADDLPDEPQPEPPTTDGGTGSGQTLPNEDDEDGSGGGDTEGDDDGDDSDGGGNGEADDDDEDGDTEGGDGDSDDDDGDDSTEGGDEDGGEGPGEGDGPRSGDGNDADTMDRPEAPKGTNDGDGAGGSGQSVSEASDPLDDYEPEDIRNPFDEESKVDDTYQQHTLSEAEQTERVTTRIDAGAFGKMRVIFR